MRVANSDWCASRIVVSVISTCFCSRIHCAKRSAPRSCRRSRVPGGGASPRWQSGKRAGPGIGLGAARPFISALPLTVTSPRNSSSLVARSRRGVNWNSSGVLSMKRVVHFPEVNSGWAMTFSRNARLLDTPRMRNSRKARSMRALASLGVWPQAVTLTSRES